MFRPAHPLLLSLLFFLLAVSVGAAGSDNTIDEVYAAARSSKDSRLARIVVNVRIVTPSWRIEPDQLRQAHHHYE